MQYSPHQSAIAYLYRNCNGCREAIGYTNIAFQRAPLCVYTDL